MCFNISPSLLPRHSFTLMKSGREIYEPEFFDVPADPGEAERLPPSSASSFVYLEHGVCLS